MKSKYFTGNTFLIEGSLSDIILFLNKNGFTKWNEKGIYECCNWVYADLITKIYAPGIPGIKITNAVFNHSITLNEFKTIYEIYLNYEQEINQGIVLSRKKKL